MGNKIQVAVAGCGYWGKNHIRNFYQLGYLAGICDVKKEAVAAVIKDYPVTVYTWDEILSHKDIHAVIIVTPHQHHKHMAIEALNQGKHVFIEKPMTLSSADASEIIAHAERNHRIVMVGHILRYHPAFRALVQFIKTTRIDIPNITHTFFMRISNITIN